MCPVFDIFGLSVQSYTAMLFAGVLFAAAVSLFTRRKNGLSVPDVLLAVLYTLLGGLLGAKLLFILVNIKSILASDNILLAMWNGGLVFYGGLIGGLLMLMLYSKKRGIRLMILADTLLPGAALGHAIGRVGCFLSGCCYGCETDSCLGVIYPPGGSAPSGVPLLPVQLFEAAFLVLLSAALFAVLFRSRRRGMTVSVYLIAYSVWRFIIEFFRTDPRGSLFGLSTSQIISIALFIAGIVMLVFILKRKK